MANEWRDVEVSYLAAESQHALSTGPFGSAISSKYFQADGVPVIRGSNLTTTIDRRLDDDGLVFISPEKAAEFSRSVARYGDLVFTCWGTIGQVGLIDDRARYDEYVISNKQMKLTPDSMKADSLFLYYVFSSPPVSDDIKNQAIGSSVPGFNLKQLKSIRVRLPPLDIQRAIASVLGALDDKIEQNRRTARALERLARAIFRAWFVDFEPVKAKAEGATQCRQLKPSACTLGGTPA
jgi:type I restriction enzyme S subunit